MKECEHRWRQRKASNSGWLNGVFWYEHYDVCNECGSYRTTTNKGAHIYVPEEEDTNTHDETTN